jgi:hypothetical protein
MIHKKCFISEERWVFLSTILLFFFFILVHGFYFERYIVFFESLFSGSISGIPLDDFETLAFVGLDIVLAKIYKLFPDIAWFDYSHIALSILTALLYLRAIAQLTIKRGMGFALGLVISLCATALVYFNLVSANFSREVILFSILMLFAFWGWNRLKPLYHYLLVFCAFCIVILTRVEFGFLAAILFGGFVLTQWRYLFAQWRWLVAPLAFFVLIGSYLYYDRNNTNDFAKESDFSQYLISDASYVETFRHFEDPKDSLRYLAAKELWLSDTASLKIEFFRSLQQYKISFSLAYFKKLFPFYFSKATSMLGSFLNDDLPFLILPILLWLYFIVESWIVIGNLKERWAVLTLPLLWVIFLLFVLCYLVRMETTVLHPFLLIATLFLLAVHNSPAPLNKLNISRFLKGLLFITLLLHFVWTNIHLNTFSRQKAKIIVFNQNTAKEADSLANGKYLMLDGYSNLILDHKPGKNFVFKKPKAVLLYDCGQLILGKHFLEYHRKICDCNPLDNVSFYSFLLAHKDELLILSNPQRNDFIKAYLHGMHQLDIDFVKLEGDFHAEKLIDIGLDIHYYTIRNSPTAAK